jgi:toxin-antitoxin system PIN domain toxin
VILVDANILIYAGVASTPQNARAKAWLDAQLSGTEAVGLPWQCLLANLRITTNRRAFPQAQGIGDAWRQVQDWLDCPRVWIPAPTGKHAQVLREVCEAGDARGDLVSDAHLAALAIEHGLTLCSNDRDFARFPRLRWTNPLD